MKNPRGHRWLHGWLVWLVSYLQAQVAFGGRPKRQNNSDSYVAFDGGASGLMQRGRYYSVAKGPGCEGNEWCPDWAEWQFELG
jgi:hypothetical protein